MKIAVNEQPQQFYLALKKWTPAVGHEIKVGQYRFSAIPVKNIIRVSEVTTGAKLYDIPVNFAIETLTATKGFNLFFLSNW
ncbi:hypothetical protein [Lentibacillus sp. Marseille-P4043]|uniref:hypothetical protein n=1 Tax=Lentibacillus sp. Marseille-P4043 TaxID=2040293 RepID=UPI001F44D9F2|nr:hypothetical protein [Lentibacillus sp. Marseille-P4043]